MHIPALGFVGCFAFVFESRLRGWNAGPQICVASFCLPEPSVSPGPSVTNVLLDSGCKCREALLPCSSRTLPWVWGFLSVESLPGFIMAILALEWRIGKHSLPSILCNTLKNIDFGYL